MKHVDRRAFAFAFLVIFGGVEGFAQSMAGAWDTSAPQPPSYGEPPLRANNEVGRVVATFDAATEADLAALRSHNKIGAGPSRVGIVRRLPEPVIASRGTSIASNEAFRWRGTVHVARASRLRLELIGVDVPSDAKFWVYGSDGPAYGFDASLAYQGALWTPSVEGQTITVEVESPTTVRPFTISSVADIRASAEVFPTDTSCAEDAKCYSGFEDEARGIAHMQFVSEGSAWICTGALLNSADEKFTPYFLTANHCIATPAEAASLETFWDFKTATCNGNSSLSGKPKTNGATVLATSQETDMTLLRLSSRPPGRYFLGWRAGVPEVGATLYRLSHPEGEPLRYSTSTVSAAGPFCTGWPKTKYIYQKEAIGGIAGGSSGSPVLSADRRVLGQLALQCGSEPFDCNDGNSIADGSLAKSYPLIQRFINPGAPITPGCSACVPNANTACMLNGRFRVTLTWNDPSANLSGNGRLIQYAENRAITDPSNGEISQVTFWSMYPNDPFSVEALVRMIRGGSSFWIFTTGFAAAEYTVTVQDTSTCATWQRTSPFGSTEKIADYDGLPF